MNARKIRTEELDLIRHLLKVADDKSERKIPTLVIELNDGNMGSLKFVQNSENKYLADLIQVKYIDTDKIEVFITLTLNNENELFELDFWKTNFDKLLKFPKLTEIIFE